ncbi:MAG: hypothetical protein ABI855_12120 [Bacteroidota bacterium]
MPESTLPLTAMFFLLLIVGSTGKDLIQKFKRTNIFLEEDFDLLLQLICRSKIIVTPGILAETSNLLETFDAQLSGSIFLKIREFLKTMEEKYTPSIDLVFTDCFLKLGFTDSSIFELSKSGVVAITVDFPLYGYLSTSGYPVINFNHVRTENIFKS